MLETPLIFFTFLPSFFFFRNMLEHSGSTRNTRTYFKLNYLHSFWFECTMRKMSSEVPLLALLWQRAFLFSCSQEDCEKGQGACSLFRRSASLRAWAFSGLSVCKGIPWVKLIVKSIACLYGKNCALSSTAVWRHESGLLHMHQVFKLFQNIS